MTATPDPPHPNRAALDAACATLARACLEAWRLLLPIACGGCGEPGAGLCDRCRLALRPVPVRLALPDGTPVVSALRYEGRAREVLLAFKEQGRTDAAAALATALHAAISELPAAPAIAQLTRLELAAVPASARAMRRRGYDPVTLLLRRTGGRPSRVLRVNRVAGATVQKRLGRDARALNRVGTMRARTLLRGRAFVLVDDVLTTGATLVEAARALREAGAVVVAAATVAWTPRRLAETRANPVTSDPRATTV